MTSSSPSRFRPSLTRLTSWALLGTLTAFSALLTGCDDGGVTGGSGGMGVPAAGGSEQQGAGGTIQGAGGTPAGTGGDMSGEPMNSACGSGDMPFKIFADEKNNIKIQANVSLPTTPMKKNDPEVVFDWSGVNTDMFGNPVSAADITHAVLVVWLDTYSIEQVAQGISTDSPELEGNALIAAYHPTAGATSAKLSSFLLPGQEPLPLDQLSSYIDGSKPLTLMLQSNPEVTSGDPKFGYSVKMMQAFALDDAGPSTVMLTNASTVITATPDLASVQDTLVPAGTNNISVDWGSTIATRGYGTNLPFPNNGISEIAIARYGGDVDLSTQFTRLEGIPLDLWRGTIYAGSSYTLNDAELTNEINPGVPFSGVPAGSTDQYLLMLLCAKNICRNPTPWYITPLKTCP